MTMGRRELDAQTGATVNAWLGECVRSRRPVPMSNVLTESTANELPRRLLAGECAFGATGKCSG